MRQGFPTLAFSWQNWIGVYDIFRKSWKITFWSLARLKLRTFSTVLLKPTIACHFIKMLFSVIDLPYMPPQWSCCYACLIRYAAGLGSFCSVILIISIVIAAAALIFFPFNFAWEIRAAKCVTLNFLMAFYCLSIGEFTSSNFG